jgi:hypothetical protein
MTKTAELQAKVAKLSTNQRALVVAALNSGLAQQDGKIPQRLRIDPITFELYNLESVTVFYDIGRISAIRPLLVALKASKEVA